ncbi:transposable element Tc1 transposase [Trichonephila clavipes]|nr:transposable element Tc1 transposase [Trichonephila clavipes]
MKTTGWSTRSVADQVDRSECAVRNCWEQWTREGTHARKTGSGATRKTTRHLAEANLKSKRTFRALFLTPEHRQLGLQWCQVRSMWNTTDWQNVVFSDESRFVWRRMIIVYGCGAPPSTLFYVTLPAQLV